LFLDAVDAITTSSRYVMKRLKCAVRIWF